MHRPIRCSAGAVALSALVMAGLAACGSDKKDTTGDTTATTAASKPASTVSIDMSDYAFAVSGPLSAGGTIKLSNKGKEIHMMGLGKLKAGKTVDDVKKALSEAGPPGGGGGEPTTSAGGATTTTGAGATTTVAGGGGEGRQDPLAELAEDMGLPGGVMSPGQSVEVTVPNLGAGKYVLICYVPTEGDGMPHFAMGMVNELEVVAGGAPATPQADATYQVAPGKPIEGPATLTPGKHTLQISAAPGSEKMEPGLAMLNPGTTPAQLNEAIGAIFESESPPPKGAATSIPGTIVYGGFDLNQTTVFFLTVDLKAGNYFMAADDTDVENPPTDPKEVINITVG